MVDVVVIDCGSCEKFGCDGGITVEGKDYMVGKGCDEGIGGGSGNETRGVGWDTAGLACPSPSKSMTRVKGTSRICGPLFMLLKTLDFKIPTNKV